MSTDLAGGQTILGCPISSFLSLETACSLTNVPPCVTATPINYDAACCGSLTSFGLSLATCLEQHAPTCLDTSGIAASITGAVSGTNPCAAYATPGGGGSGSSGSDTSAMPTTSAAVMTSAGSSVASAATPATTATGGAATTPAGTSPSASATGKSAAPKVSAGLKVYIGVALVGALAVLAM